MGPLLRRGRRDWVGSGELQLGRSVEVKLVPASDVYSTTMPAGRDNANVTGRLLLGRIDRVGSDEPRLGRPLEVKPVHASDVNPTTVPAFLRGWARPN
ncbi:hypothetical protein NL676_037555 [Syzygium grande]|nr:hypothetical protein NL676_037555 [Syzygium grande]